MPYTTAAPPVPTTHAAGMIAAPSHPNMFAAAWGSATAPSFSFLSEPIPTSLPSMGSGSSSSTGSTSPTPGEFIKRVAKVTPPEPYPVMLTKVLLDAPGNRLSVRQIYSVLEQRHPNIYIAGSSDTKMDKQPGWCNTVRYTLSRCPVFERITRSQDQVKKGRGQQWAIAPDWMRRIRELGLQDALQHVQGCRRSWTTIGSGTGSVLASSSAVASAAMPESPLSYEFDVESPCATPLPSACPSPDIVAAGATLPSPTSLHYPDQRQQYHQQQHQYYQQSPVMMMAATVSAPVQPPTLQHPGLNGVSGIELSWTWDQVLASLNKHQTGTTQEQQQDVYPPPYCYPLPESAAPSCAPSAHASPEMAPMTHSEFRNLPVMRLPEWSGLPAAAASSSYGFMSPPTPVPVPISPITMIEPPVVRSMADADKQWGLQEQQQEQEQFSVRDGQYPLMLEQFTDPAAEYAAPTAEPYSFAGWQ
ncbi:hypothetical protein BC828DRAFT_55397 [Blastocladiella britannica]|nr:hypothetical protein BC828DRAFT_55397 [Blastocladiella britannica]